MLIVVIIGNNHVTSSLHGNFNYFIRKVELTWVPWAKFYNITKFCKQTTYSISYCDYFFRTQKKSCAGGASKCKYDITLNVFGLDQMPRKWVCMACENFFFFFFSAWGQVTKHLRKWCPFEILLQHRSKAWVGSRFSPLEWCRTRYTGTEALMWNNASFRKYVRVNKKRSQIFIRTAKDY